MVNVGLNGSSLLGIALAVAGAALYFLRTMRPKLARDYDIFFAAVALLCGGILFFQGWRQDPILQFGQFLLTGSAIFFAVENIRLRSVTTEQAKRSTPIVDEERPVSRVYRAELDELAYDDRPTARRIRGSRDSRGGRDDYDEGGRRRSAGRSVMDDRTGPSSSRNKRRPRSEDGSIDAPPGFQEDVDVWEDRPARSRSTPASSGNPSSTSRPKRPRSDDPEVTSQPRSRRSEPDSASSEYVDYRPVNDDSETDNWGDY